MQLKHKIIALGIIPLLISVALISVLIFWQNHSLGEHQARLIENSILVSKRTELKNYVALSLSAIEPLYANGQGDGRARRQALQALAELGFGEDGYFFVYDASGRSLMHPRQADIVGKNMWNLKDPNGLPAVQALLHTAQAGDGFLRYAWRKPSSGQVTAKLAYVVMLPQWDWMLGTGIYLEDVQQAIQQARSDIAAKLQATMLAIAGVALLAVLLVFICAMALNVREQRLADQRLQALNQRIVTLQEDERSRVSRELHDGISQLLVSIKFQFELASHQLEIAPAPGWLTLQQAISQLGTAIGEVRRISHDLHPSLLDTLGLSAAIGQLSAEFEQRTGLEVVFDDALPDGRLPDGIAVALFRIVQEALTNIERHAGARNVDIRLGLRGGLVRLVITDDGCGFDPRQIEQMQGGIGLRNMRERVEYFGGRFWLSSASECTRIRVVLPLSAMDSGEPA